MSSSKVVTNAASQPVPKQGEAADGIELRNRVAQPLSWQDPQANSVERRRVKILGFNDFHGQLLSRSIEGRPVGGAAVLAAYFADATRGFEGATIIAHGGDMLGASPPYSALYQDEPTVAFLNMLGNAACSTTDRANRGCNLVAVVGNHEFDEGSAEFRRMVRGGQHHQGPFLGTAYAGPTFPFLGANVIESASGRSLLLAHTIKAVGGTRIGFVGAVLKNAPTFLIASGIGDVRFEDEVEHINKSVAELKAQGVRAIVVIIHQGGNQIFEPGLPRDASAVKGAVVGIVRRLDEEVDVVVAGHTHSPLLALLPNAAGRPTLLTQAFHSSTAFADIELSVDGNTGDVVAKSARLVTTFADAGPGLVPDAKIAAYVEQVAASVRDKTGRVLGEALVGLTRTPDRAGQSVLGNLVADAQRTAIGTDFAFITPAWLRADLQKGLITWGDLFAVQPFGNRLIRVELTGAQVLELLNQQWLDESYNRLLCVSGLSYHWDSRRPAHDRVVSVKVGEQPIIPDRVYTATVNEFLAEGGEGYSVLAGLARSDTGLGDLEALVRWQQLHPKLQPPSDARIQRDD